MKKHIIRVWVVGVTFVIPVGFMLTMSIDPFLGFIWLVGWFFLWTVYLLKATEFPNELPTHTEETNND